MNVFIDTNILIDVIANRTDFVENSLQILRYCESKQITGFISALSIANIMYICKKNILKEKLNSIVITVSKIFNIVDLTKKDILQALQNDYADYEDAIQIIAANKVKTDYIITRDTNHFNNSPIPVINPKNFLELL
jgi:predicted nucleic acid-binding protein